MIKKLLYLIFIFSFLIAKSQSGETFQSKQVAGAKKFINFIYIQNAKGVLIPYGTGFFVGKQIDSNRGIIFLATARHVLKNEIGGYLNKIFLRYNLKNNSSEVEESKLTYDGVEKNVFLHPDSTVDIALIPLSGNFENLDLEVLQINNMLQKSDFEKNGVAEGTDVFFTGLFTQYMGDKRNNPITRFGKISLVPSEKIFFVDSKRDLIFLETTSYGGNSGSPVFVSYESKGFHIRKLIGIMTGTYQELNELGVLTNSIQVSKENSGISVITPCDYLIDMINLISHSIISN